MDFAVYAIETCGPITTRVLRGSYWDTEADETVQVEDEVKIDGLPDRFGLCDVLAETPDTLTDLAAVCQAAAELPLEAQTSSTRTGTE